MVKQDNNTKLSKRKFSKYEDTGLMELCSYNCPFLKYTQCLLYYEDLETTGYGDFRRPECIRNSLCVADIIPDSNSKIIKLLTEINNKLR